MRFALAAALAVLIVPVSSLAEPGRYSDSDYLRASRCAALSGVPSLKAEAGDMSWLSQALKDQRRGREDFILTKAKDTALDIARIGRKANTEEKIADLRAQRASACQGLGAPPMDSARGPMAPQG